MNPKLKQDIKNSIYTATAPIYEAIEGIYVNATIEQLTSYNAVPANRFIEYDGRLCRFGNKSAGVALGAVTNAGETIQVAVTGVAQIEAGADLTIGADVCSDANGKGIPYESGSLVNGVALETKSAGQLCKIILRP